METSRPGNGDAPDGSWFSPPEELQALARHMARLGGWELHVDTGIVAWDEEVASSHGLPSTRQLGIDAALAPYTAESRLRFRACLDACIRDGTSFDDEFELRAPSTPSQTRATWLRGIGRARRDAGGRVVAVHGACQNITERRLAQAQAETLALQMQATLDGMSDAFVMLDDAFRIVFINRAAVSESTFERHELLGMTLWEGFPRTVGSRYETETRRAMRERVPVVFEERSRPPREHRWVEVRQFPAANGGLSIYFRDITKRRQAEAERLRAEAHASQAQKMEALGTLAGGIAHDFNNMLSAILGNTGLALEHAEAGHPVRRYLEQIRSASQRARELVRRILSFSRTETAMTASRVQPLAPVLEEALAMLKAMLPTTVDLRAHVSGTPVHANLDATSLQQVLLNLCTNAWQSLPESKGRVDVGLEPVTLDDTGASPPGSAPIAPGAYAHVWVADNGTGIDEATRLRLFEPFFTTKPRGQGTGLGLPAVQGIVEAHGGRIVVESTPGQGSTFHVYLPARSPVGPEAVDAVAPPESAGGNRCVLLVDDDPIVLLATEHLLLRLGYRVLPHADAHQALAALADAPQAVDVVVTDFSMPAMSGLDLAREVVRLRADLPIVLSSGYISDEVRSVAHGAGIRALLHKEDAFEQLGAVLGRVLAAGP